MATATVTETPSKRIGFSFNIFKRSKGSIDGGTKPRPKKEATPEQAEFNTRKVLVAEGHKYLSKATDLINNRDHQHRFERGHLELLQDRWMDLYGSAPKGKKLTKGLMSPSDFKEKSKILLEDVQAAYDGLRIDRNATAPPHQETEPEVQRSHSRSGGTSLHDHGPVPAPERLGSLKRDQKHQSSGKSSRRHQDPIPEEVAEAADMGREQNGVRRRDRKPRDEYEDRYRDRGYDRPRDDKYYDGRDRDRDRDRDRRREDGYYYDRDGKRHRENYRDRDDRYYDDDYRRRDRDKYYDDSYRRRHRDGQYDRDRDRGAYRERDKDRYYDERYRDEGRRHRDKEKKREPEGVGEEAATGSGVMMAPTYIPYPEGDPERKHSGEKRERRRERDRDRDRYRDRDPERDSDRDRRRRDRDRRERAQHEHRVHEREPIDAHGEDPNYAEPHHVAEEPTYATHPGPAQVSRHASSAHRSTHLQGPEGFEPESIAVAGQDESDQMAPLMIPPPRARQGTEPKSRFQEDFTSIYGGTRR